MQQAILGRRSGDLIMRQIIELHKILNATLVKLKALIVSEITLYNVLKAKIYETEAQTVVEGIKQEVKSQFDQKKDLFTSKQNISELGIDIEKGFKDNIKWSIVTLLSVAGLIIAAIKIL